MRAELPGKHRLERYWALHTAWAADARTRRGRCSAPTCRATIRALFRGKENKIVAATSAMGLSADRESSAAALRAFFGICDAWELDGDEVAVLLGGPRKRTCANWRRNPARAPLARDTLERVSYVLGIYKGLQVLLPNPESADGWIKKPNSAAIFGGGSALERMLAGNVSDLYLVRNYLDVLRGGGA